MYKKMDFKGLLNNLKTKSHSSDNSKIKTRYHRIRNNSNKDFKSKKISLVKPIFIVGFPHSGTSVLTSIFKNHMDLANWTEASEVWEPQWIEGQDSDYDRLIPKYENDVDEMDLTRITEAFYRFVKSQKKKRLINKNPRNSTRILYIKKIFPDAKIIHIYRDGREVVNSVTRNMDNNMIKKICERWVKTINEIKKQQSKVSKLDFFEIKYEEFCEKPREIIEKAFQICELELNESQEERIPSKLDNFNGNWMNEIDTKYHSLMRKKLEKTMQKLGYIW